MKKPIIITDPYPRSLKLIFYNKTLKKLKNKFLLIKPKYNKDKFYKKKYS